MYSFFFFSQKVHDDASENKQPSSGFRTKKKIYKHLLQQITFIGFPISVQDER